MAERKDININKLMQGWPSGDGDGFVIHFFIDASVRVRYPAQFEVRVRQEPLKFY